MSRALADKVALVTGGARGIGRAVVERFADEGASVVVLDLAAAELEPLGAETDRVVGLEGDVRDADANRRAVELACERYGALDVLVPNAAVFDGFVALEDMPPDVLDAAFAELFDINVRGYLLATQAALPELRRARGAVVMTASVAGSHAGGGGPLYTASKHAVVGLVRQLAWELAPEVRVNGVAPGGTLTGLTTTRALAACSRPVDEAGRAGRIAAGNPLRIAPRPEDHVGAYVLLASDDSRTLTGVVINSDGGLDARPVTSLRRHADQDDADGGADESDLVQAAGGGALPEQRADQGRGED